MRARIWMVALTAACGGGDDGPADAQIPDSGALCSETPGTRFIMERAGTYGTLPGAAFPGQMCIEGRSDIPCVMPLMQAGGQFLMCVPESGGFGLEMVHTGHELSVHLHGEGTTGGGWGAPDNAFAENTFWAPAVPAAYPPTDKGFFIFNLFVSREPSFPIGLAGGTVTLDPAPARAAIYGNEDGIPQVGLTETSDEGLVVIADVDPGMYDVTIGGLTNCAISTGAGWESPVGTAQARIPAIAGKTVIASFYCDDPTP